VNKSATTEDSEIQNNDCQTKLEPRQYCSTSTFDKEFEMNHVTIRNVASENISNDNIQSTTSTTKPGLNKFEEKRQDMVRKALTTYIYALLCSNICVLFSLAIVIFSIAFNISTQFTSDMALLGPFLNALFNPFIYVINIEAFRRVICCKKVNPGKTLCIN
jgi:hypothetical protein